MAMAEGAGKVQHPALPEGGVDADRVVLSSDVSVSSMSAGMPEPDVREQPDAGAIHWHAQVEPGIPEESDGDVLPTSDRG